MLLKIGAIVILLVGLSSQLLAADLLGRLVLAPHQAPVVAAQVSVSCNDLKAITVKTDYTGRYRVARLPNGARCVVMVRHNNIDTNDVRLRTRPGNTWLNLELLRLPQRWRLRSR